MALDPRYVNPEKTIAMQAFPGVVLQVLSGQVTREHFERSLPWLEHPILGDRYVQLIRIAPTSIKEIPDDEFRKAAAQMLKQQSGRLAALAFVVAGEGFLSSMSRAVITGVSLLARAAHHEKVFSEPLAAATWLASQSPSVVLVPEQIVRSLDELIALTR
jgi:hypothetical protein